MTQLNPLHKALFLDRDGILNRVIMRGEKVSSPWLASEFKVIDEAKQLVSHAKQNQFLTIVVTNQPDVSKGLINQVELEIMHQQIQDEFEVDAIEVCTSVDNADPRRKPNPGMLFEASKNLNVDLAQSFFIGDSDKDIIAGKNAGVKTILLQTDYNTAIHGTGDFNCNSLLEARQIVAAEFTTSFLAESTQIISALSVESIEATALVLRRTRDRGGRLFLLGSGGGAGHASHATCDFRKLCGFEAYAPADNVSELTARINDEGWESSLSNYLKGSRLSAKDCLLIFSVGGGCEKNNISGNLVSAVAYAKEIGAAVVGVVGRDGGFTASNADACVIIPTVNDQHITPHTEAFQALVWHLLVSHPLLKLHQTKWESESKNSKTSGK